MDTAICDGDFLLDSNDRPFLISGEEELLQRVLIRLTVKKGSFVYDKELGSRMHTLKGYDGNLQSKVFAFVKEALLDMKEVKVENVFVKLLDGGEKMNVKAVLLYNNNKREVEISL